MSDDLDFIVIDDIPEYVFCIPDDEELENVIPIKGEDGSFKYEKVAELPETGEDGVLYLVPKSHETQTASGNPISINVTEGAGKLSDLKLDSDTSQTTYSGKNLLEVHSGTTATFGGVTATRQSDGSILLGGTATANAWLEFGVDFKNGTSAQTTPYALLDSTKTYTLSSSIRSGTYTSGGGGTNVTIQGSTTTPSNWSCNIAGSATVTGANGIYRAYIRISTGDVFSNAIIQPQLELGSTATDWEKYVGGIPAPNPAYPQDINVVTGTQTIDINGTSYPINLGNIELAETGTYRDYIHKVGNEWKVHKATGKVVLDGTIQVTASGAYTNASNYCVVTSNTYDSILGAVVPATSDFFTNYSASTLYAGMPAFDEARFSVGAGGASKLRFAMPTSLLDMTTTTTQADSFKAWLNAHNVTVYYALATATDTTITDTALIAQLEAARNAGLANGTNVISNTATGANLAGDLELSYYEYDPTNKYNKWLWLDDDAAYEQM